MVNGGHFGGIVRIPGVAQGCNFGNQAKNVLIPPGNTNQAKSFIGKEITRSLKFLLD